MYLCATKRLQVFLLLNMICLQYTLNGLPSNMRYNLKLAGVTQAIFSKRFLVGEFTPPVTFTLGGWCFTVVSVGTRFWLMFQFVYLKSKF